MGNWLVTDGVLHFVVSDSPLCGSSNGEQNGVPCPRCLQRLLEAVTAAFDASNPWLAA